MGNKIADVSPLGSLISLHTLSLWGNEITDVQPLARLTNLQWLQLGDNAIADISPLGEPNYSPRGTQSPASASLVHPKDEDSEAISTVIGLVRIRLFPMRPG